VKGSASAFIERESREVGVEMNIDKNLKSSLYIKKKND
jgi:hypothetical protein